MTASPIDESEIYALHRPDSSLMTYYALRSLVLGPLFFVILIPLVFRYRSLRYTFDDEGVAVRWGVLFRREINLTYSRIQDIHLSSNAVERWLGLARIQVQTASGSSKAEMTIEGMKQFEAIRDFLYSRMRGTRSQSEGAAVSSARATAGASAAVSASGAGIDPVTAGELTTTLRQVAIELRALRGELHGLRERVDGRSDR